MPRRSQTAGDFTGNAHIRLFNSQYHPPCHRTRVNRTIGNQQTTVHARDIQSLGNVATFVDRYRSLYPVQIGAGGRHQRRVEVDDHLLISHSLFAGDTDEYSDQLNTCPDCRKINYLPDGYNCFVSKNFCMPCWGICS